MKYTRLTKEQFEELHPEFINYLAAQGVDADLWTKIKATDAQKADHHLDQFSDIVWANVLKEVKYLEHFSASQIFMFEFGAEKMKLIAIRVTNKPDVDLTTKEGYQWLREHLLDDDVEVFTSDKDYQKNRHEDAFKIIEQGGNVTKGELYQYFDKLFFSEDE